MIVFLVAATASLGLIVWLLISPPSADLALGSRKSPPSGTLTHDVVSLDAAPVPTPIPAFTPPCDAVGGLIVEGGPAAQNRIKFVLERLCELESDSEQPPELREAIRYLVGIKIRFALFTRTGEQSTSDVVAERIFLNVDLARTSVDPIAIAPLLVHEAWHMRSGPLTATLEYEARVAELQACRVVYADREPSRGCRDAQAIVALGRESAVELLVRAGYPR
jgi:hypothetical protein